jgi:hypothetical protein
MWNQLVTWGPIGLSLVLAAALTRLARGSNLQFAIGAAVVFVSTLAIYIWRENYIYEQTRIGGSGYNVSHLIIACLYLVAHISIWRSFRKPGFVAFATAAIVAWVLFRAGFWEWIS